VIWEPWFPGIGRLKWRRFEGVNGMDKVMFENEPEVIEIEDLEIEELQERIVPSRYAIS